VRCGGTSTLAIADGAVVIDLSLMCGVTIDNNNEVYVCIIYTYILSQSMLFIE
jgi:hypothetical protein